MKGRASAGGRTALVVVTLFSAAPDPAGGTRPDSQLHPGVESQDGVSAGVQAECGHPNAPEGPPAGRIGSVEGIGSIEVREAPRSVPICSLAINQVLTVTWPQHTEAIDVGPMRTIVAPVIQLLGVAFEAHARLFGASLEDSPWGGGIHVALVPAIEPTTLGGFHHFDADTGLSTVYLSLDPTAVSGGTGTRWLDVIDHTATHELFHAVQHQLRTASLERPRGWITEALADWAARQVTREDPPMLSDGSFLYHRAMGRLFESIADGLTATDYSAHLFWHWWIEENGVDRLRGLLRLYQASGRNRDVATGLDVAASWHRFGLALLHRGPWKELLDSPPFPQAWTLSVQEIHVVEVDGTMSVTARLPPLSVRRYKIALARGPAEIRLSLDTAGNGAREAGIEASLVSMRFGMARELRPGDPVRICRTDRCTAPRSLRLPGERGVDLVLTNSAQRVLRTTVTSVREPDRQLPLLQLGPSDASARSIGEEEETL